MFLLGKRLSDLLLELHDAIMIMGIFNVFRTDSALIAGGCIRDAFLDREFKDIDILVHNVDGHRDYDELDILANRLGYSCKLAIEGGYMNDDPDDPLICVYKLTRAGFHDIDVIFLSCPPMERAKNFPCTLSQFYYNKKLGIHYSDEAYLSMKSKVIKYNPSTARPNYIKKMKEYFPDWEHNMEEQGFVEVSVLLGKSPSL